jgi:putative Holliday junction resolvase
MRTLAIDYGTVRTGLAMSDSGGRFATPLEVVEETDRAKLIAHVRRIIEREAVTRLVVGLPLNMDDTLGPMARKTIELGSALRAPGVEVVFVDERLSSFEASSQLVDQKRAGAKMTRADKKKRLDAVAASVFLQEFLDGHLQAINVETVNAGRQRS